MQVAALLRELMLACGSTSALTIPHQQLARHGLCALRERMSVPDLPDKDDAAPDSCSACVRSCAKQLTEAWPDQEHTPMITMSQVMSNKLAAAMLLLTNMARCRQQCTPQLIAGRVEIVRSALHRANHAASLSVADALLRTMVQSIASQECACARALVGALIQPVAWIAKQVLRSISTGPVFTLAVDSTMQRQVIICAEALVAGQAAANADGLYVLPKVLQTMENIFCSCNHA